MKFLTGTIASAPLPLEKLSSLRCASLSAPPWKDRWRHPPRDRSTIPPCNVMMVNHFYLLYINGDGDYDGHRPFSITGLRNCPMDRPLGSTLRNNSWITAPFQFSTLQQGQARLKMSNLKSQRWHLLWLRGIPSCSLRASVAALSRGLAPHGCSVGSLGSCLLERWVFWFS